MKILACVKASPDWDKVLETDWANFAPEEDILYAETVFNCFDESALELALRLKESALAVGEECVCNVATVGRDLSAPLAETLFAVGFDDVTVLEAACEYNSREVANHLAVYAQREGCDVIITGSQAGRADTGTVPLWLARRLGLTPLCEICDLAFDEDGLRVQQLQTDGLWERRITTPALLLVGNSPAVLRAVSLRTRLQAKGKRAQLQPMDVADTPQPRLILPERGRVCSMLHPHNGHRPAAPVGEIAELLIKEQLSDIGNTGRSTDDFITDNKHGVVKYDAADISPKTIAALVQDYKQRQPDCVILPDTAYGRALAVSLADETGCALATGLYRLRLGETALCDKRVCSSHLIWQRELAYPLACTFSGQLNIQTVRLPKGGRPHWLLGERMLQPPCFSSLDNSRMVVVCGAGMGNKDNCQKARQLAANLGAGFGLTRPAALNGWGAAAEIVGQSGSSIAPSLCITLGVSGASAFMVGIEGAGKVIAVSTDKRALIYKNANLGIAVDAPALVDALLNRL